MTCLVSWHRPALLVYPTNSWSETSGMRSSLQVVQSLAVRASSVRPWSFTEDASGSSGAFLAQGESSGPRLGLGGCWVGLVSRSFQGTELGTVLICFNDASSLGLQDLSHLFPLLPHRQSQFLTTLAPVGSEPRKAKTQCCAPDVRVLGAGAAPATVCQDAEHGCGFCRPCP